MPNFLENIFAELARAKDRVVLREIRGSQFTSITGGELLEQIARVRGALGAFKFERGDRAAILAPNSIRWTALDLALMAEGVIVVPLYSRQVAGEIAGMVRDCQPKVVFTSEAELAEAVQDELAEPPGFVNLQALFDAAQSAIPVTVIEPKQDTELLTIIYTSGTSGEPKGVCLNIKNLNHMIGCTTERLNQLMGQTAEPDQIFLYAPLNFAASWMLMLTALTRKSVLTFSTDLTKLADEIRLSEPHYFLNVPTLLDRVKRAVEENISKQIAPIRAIYAHAKESWQRQHVGRGKTFDGFWLSLGQKLIFGKVKKRFGPNLRALICGSAPLAPETQQFFLMIGIPVLQAYGLTETTALCTLDDPRVPVEPGYVGVAVPGIEMKLDDNDEIVVRGPNIFPGYWNRPEETAKVLREGWFHTGDQGEVNVRGNWRIIGRLKNLLVLNSGHKFAPEPIEDKLAQMLPAAQQVALVGNGRGYVCALLTGPVDVSSTQTAIDALNPELPHYRQIRKFTILKEPFTPENGLLTVNGKIKRDAVSAKYFAEIAEMYDKKS